MIVPLVDIENFSHELNFLTKKRFLFPDYYLSQVKHQTSLLSRQKKNKRDFFSEISNNPTERGIMLYRFARNNVSLGNNCGTSTSSRQAQFNSGRYYN